MKTIAILTDFSQRSEHAAHYALHLAQKIKADVLVFNSFLAPSDIPMVASEVAWPLDYEENRLETENALKKLTKKLEHWSANNQLVTDYAPRIGCQCEQGPLDIAIAAIERNKDIFLVVAGTHGTDGLTTLMLGDNCRKITDLTKIPLLIVPEHARLKSPENFAFATGLDFADIPHLDALAHLARHFSAEIVVTHIHEKDKDDYEELQSFKKRVTNKVGYRKIVYETATGNNPREGLDWVLAHNKPDVLVMVHHDKGLFASIFKGSQTQKMVSHTPVPLLVFPSSSPHAFNF